EGNKPDDVMHFIVREGDRGCKPTIYVFFPFCHSPERRGEGHLKRRPRISADVALFGIPGSRGRRKEGGNEDQNSTSGFYQSKTDLESAPATQALKAEQYLKAFRAGVLSCFSSRSSFFVCL
ncbi:hypothetical protein GOODEAATRI_001776, partial [Goodea atripinnis]